MAAQFAARARRRVPGRGPGGEARSRETASLEAYRAVMEGWLRIETLDVRELPRAIADFERAVAVDRALCPRLDRARHGGVRLVRIDAVGERARRRSCSIARSRTDGRRCSSTTSLAEAHGSLALILVSAWDTAGAIRAARRAVALEPANWRHLFRLGHATWGEERLRAGAATLALYPDFAFAYFQSAMVHVARGHLTEAEGVLRHGAAIQDRQIGRGERYPALGLHWLLGLVRLAQDDVEDALVEFERERELAEPHRLYGREYAMHAALGRGAALLRPGTPRRGRRPASTTRSRSIRITRSRISGWPSPAAPASSRSNRALATVRIAPSRSSPPCVRAQMLAVQGREPEAARILTGAIEAAPPGFAGWTAAGRSVLLQLADRTVFTPVFALLADRAR